MRPEHPAKASKTLRQDAQRRRTELLDAAEQVFAEKGFDVPLGEICDAAGVGRATLYRNFDGRLALALAIFERNLQSMDDVVSAAAPGAPLLEPFLRIAYEAQCRSGRITFAMLGAGRDADALGVWFVRIANKLFQACRERHELHPDVTAYDLMLTINMFAGVTAVNPSRAPSEQERRKRRERAIALAMRALSAA